MGIRFACHHCSKPLNIKHDLAGKRGVCPECRTRFRIPHQDAPTSTPLDSEPRAATASAGPAQTGAKSAGKPVPSVSTTSVAATTVIDDDPEAAWYVRPPNGGQYGPAGGEVLRQWIAEGRVAATALLWRDGWPQWRSASEVLAEVADQLPGADSPPKLVSPDAFPGPAAFGPASSGPASSGPASSGPAASGTTPGHAAARAATSVQVAGQEGIGASKRGRSMRRILMISILLAVACALIGVLVVLIRNSA